MIHTLGMILLAMGGQQSSGESGNVLVQFLPLILIILVFYFFMIRPQMKKQKEIKKYRENLQKGDKVVTVGGIYGKITEVKEQAVLLDIAEGVNIKVDKNGLVKDANDVGSK